MTEETIEEPIVEEYEPEPIKVYVQIDSGGTVTAINSSAFIQNPTEWKQIDEGYGDRYHHAQGNYLPKPIMDEQGCRNYKLIDLFIVERAPEEKQAEIDARPAPPPAPQEQITALTEDVEAVAVTMAYNLEDTAAIAEMVAYSLEDATALGEALAGALEEIEALKARIAVLEGE